MTPRGLVDRGRKRVKSLVLAMKTFSSTQLGPDRVARNAFDPGMWDYWWTLIRDLRTALEEQPLDVEALRSLLEQKGRGFRSRASQEFR